MIRARELTLKGFLTHKDSKFELHPLLNVITGATGSGKTCFLWAFRLLSQNEPLGTEYINYDSEQADVTLTTENNTISRTRGKYTNEYGFDGEVLKGFGAAVPQEVSDALGMFKVDLGGVIMWLNYSPQDGNPFLIFDTPGQIAKILGALAGTADVDLAGKLTNSDLIQFRNKVKRYKEDAEQREEELIKYQNLEDLFSMFNLCQLKLEDIKDTNLQVVSLREYQQKNTRLNALICLLNTRLSNLFTYDISTQKTKVFLYRNLSEMDTKYKYFSSEIENKELIKSVCETAFINSIYASVRETLLKLKDVCILLEALEKNKHFTQIASKKAEKTKTVTEYDKKRKKLVSLQKQTSTLIDLLRDLLEIEFAITSAKERLKALPKTNVKEIKTKLKDLKTFSELKTINTTLTVRKKTLEYSLSNTKEAVQDAIDEYATVLRLLKECPLCGSTISEDHIKKCVLKLERGS